MLAMSIILIIKIWGGFKMCTSIKMQAKDGSLIFARTMDWHPFNPQVLTIPKKYQWVSTTDTSKILINKFKVMGVGHDIPNIHVDISDGINEHGLAVQKLTSNQQFNNDKNIFKNDRIYLAPFEVVTWILGNCTSVNDVIDKIKNIQVIPDIDKDHAILGQNLHYALTDPTGKLINLETIGAQLRVVKNPIGVVTNSPNLQREIAKLDQFLDFSKPATHLNAIASDDFNGKHTMPGGFNPSARFIRATILKEHAITPENRDENIIETWHILDSVNVPKSHNRSDTYTIYQSAVDLTSHRLYFQKYDDLSISIYDFN